jgi:hypothetical protein
MQEEMRDDGDTLLKAELTDPTSGSLHQLVRRISQLAVVSRRPIVPEDVLVFKSLVEVYKCTLSQLFLWESQHNWSVEGWHTL